jgi:hypothetical protein
MIKLKGNLLVALCQQVQATLVKNDQSTVRYRTKRTSSSQRSVSERWKSPPPTQPLLPALEQIRTIVRA